MNDVFHYEDLGVKGDRRLVLIESKQRDMPIPSDKSIRGKFIVHQPDIPLDIAKRDDVRNSAVLSIPAAVPWHKVVAFVHDLGAMTGC